MGLKSNLLERLARGGRLPPELFEYMQTMLFTQLVKAGRRWLDAKPGRRIVAESCISEGEKTITFQFTEDGKDAVPDFFESESEKEESES